MGASMIPHRILLEAVKRRTQERIVNSNAVKRWKLAESRDGKVYRAGTVGACRAAWEKRASSSSARRARPLSDPVLELSRHARGTRCPIRPMAPFLQKGEVSGDEVASSEVPNGTRSSIGHRCGGLRNRLPLTNAPYIRPPSAVGWARRGGHRAAAVFDVRAPPPADRDPGTLLLKPAGGEPWSRPLRSGL
jgi:hypothetical protein